MNKQLRCTGDQHGWRVACKMVWELILHNSVFNLRFRDCLNSTIEWDGISRLRVFFPGSSNPYLGSCLDSRVILAHKNVYHRRLIRTA